MDPQIDYLGEENKYGVTQSDAVVPEGEELNTPAPTETQTESKGLVSELGSELGSGGRVGQLQQPDSESEQTTPMGGTGDDNGDSIGGGNLKGGTNYSPDSVEGGKPTGGTNYSGATLEGEPGSTGGTDYSSTAVGGGNPTGGTDFSGADLGLPTNESTSDSTDTAAEPAAPEKKHHHLFGL